MNHAAAREGTTKTPAKHFRHWRIRENNKCPTSQIATLVPPRPVSEGRSSWPKIEALQSMQEYAVASITSDMQPTVIEAGIIGVARNHSPDTGTLGRGRQVCEANSCRPEVRPSASVHNREGLRDRKKAALSRPGKT